MRLQGSDIKTSKSTSAPLDLDITYYKIKKKAVNNPGNGKNEKINWSSSLFLKVQCSLKILVF